ncbi:MAG: SDR family NAD(P)-dependent oxidoreductase [Moraxella sp.]|nr:SDR family NAD(P)-dependent oxidoreductase [Moraxella sp.]
MTTHHKHCVIIGGTSGIGLALAKDYLDKSWQVTIVGSNADKIHALCQHYQNNDNLTIKQCDITNARQRQRLFDELANMPMTHFIYSAGIYYNERKLKLSKAQSEQILAVNLQAFCQCVEWASEQLKKYHQNTRLIAIASVAGLLNFEQMSLYARCKRAMIEICQAYQLALEPFGIGVNCIACGYIDTQKLRELNAGSAQNKPFLSSEKQAVREINHAIGHNIKVHIFPKPMKYVVKALGSLPKPLLSQMMKLQYRQQDKKLS